MTNPNTIWANIVVDELYRSGVRTICISPGSRSTPLVLACANYREFHQDLQLLVHIDERSAGFFALGLAKVTKQPVALVCTSGTAAANYYPAIIEAFYSEIPLVVMTADRPPELRDCGAGQTIDQIQMYGNHTRYFFEVGTPEISEFKLNYLRSLISHSVSIARGESFTLAGAVHLNFAFADPLLPNFADYPLQLDQNLNQKSHIQTIKGKNILSESAIAQIADQLKSYPKGIIVVGVYDVPLEIKPKFEAAVKALAIATGYPLLAEATGMNRHGVISHYDSFLRSPQFTQTHIPDLVIRFGAMPTSKAYQLWLQNQTQQITQQIIIGNGKNTDPTHNFAQIINADPINFCLEVTNYLKTNNYQPPNYEQISWQQKFTNIESITKAAVNNFLSKIHTLFDGKVYSELAQWLPEYTYLYVANSTAIRDLDSFFHSDLSIPVLVNRGANGIDGTLSSALGAAWGCDRPMILICGDLAFYHDLNGLMAVKKYGINLTVILLNNDGGGIFQMLPIAKFNPPFEEFFGTAHGLDFAPIVKSYGCDYVKIQNWQHLQEAVLESLQTQGTQVLEIKSDRQINQKLHQQFWQYVISEVNTASLD
ncbi:2-succinyl-5-enolpyruvyl-6-hydroxy-3-cyclohexene-1-carboxylic-acid synthase [Synechococcus sp. PCC 7502]|uniref:2-succinyl-5-enolpyruvyl-6-hydroxy-3- cyclohexene-1-carboxylic-acid synthase n=1 Tax=Synechococcus sp. PCC 7502 TaxID=1173263 RepID=UPI00029F915C|nr:2-succinyl-5-enolpyruvyl-6-hydroxy-3-cyclohexene-1-carboxylic-acid synthase [Synechococcus sp. PCC 7502]AFY73002.1 2-succinyl-5-enolpyruvyl-6-hydroxy-3-cyclohexene-1-carboxylic-acid synthase [Synechococcus sp. PCC 7502]